MSVKLPGESHDWEPERLRTLTMRFCSEASLTSKNGNIQGIGKRHLKPGRFVSTNIGCCKSCAVHVGFGQSGRGKRIVH